MKRVKSLFLIATFCFLIVSCGNQKNATNLNNTYSEMDQISLKEYPKLNGYHANTIKADPKENEELYKIQVVPGKTMEVDCNKYFLNGKYERKTNRVGSTYFVFLSDGKAGSTMMGCPDNSKHTAFVTGPTIFTEYTSRSPIVVYTPDGIELKHRIWEGSKELKQMSTSNPTSTGEATEALKEYPESMEGYDRYILILPEKTENSKEQKIEVVPGKTAQVDCNKHFIKGTYDKKEVEGWGYDYLIFKSDGVIGSTRMACPDQEKKEEFVSGNTYMVDYNSHMPIVVYAPKGLEVRYRIWETPQVNR